MRIYRIIKFECTMLICMLYFVKYMYLTLCNYYIFFIYIYYVSFMLGCIEEAFIQPLFVITSSKLSSNRQQVPDSEKLSLSQDQSSLSDQQIVYTPLFYFSGEYFYIYLLHFFKFLIFQGTVVMQQHHLRVIHYPNRVGCNSQL